MNKLFLKMIILIFINDIFIFKYLFNIIFTINNKSLYYYLFIIT